MIRKQCYALLPEAGSGKIQAQNLFRGLLGREGKSEGVGDDDAARVPPALRQRRSGRFLLLIPMGRSCTRSIDYLISQRGFILRTNLNSSPRKAHPEIHFYFPLPPRSVRPTRSLTPEDLSFVRFLAANAEVYTSICATGVDVGVVGEQRHGSNRAVFPQVLNKVSKFLILNATAAPHVATRSSRSFRSRFNFDLIRAVTPLVPLHTRLRKRSRHPIERVLLSKFRTHAKQFMELEHILRNSHIMQILPLAYTFAAGAFLSAGKRRRAHSNIPSQDLELLRRYSLAGKACTRNSHGFSRPLSLRNREIKSLIILEI